MLEIAVDIVLDHGELPFPTLANPRAGMAVGAKGMHLERDNPPGPELQSSGNRRGCGVVLVTDPPAGGDHFLRQGESLPVRGGWPVVVQARSALVVRLS